MKNAIYLLLFLFFMSGMSLTAQDCDFTAQYPSSTQTVGIGDSPTLFTTCSFTGEYSLSTGYFTGKTYIFESNIPGDYFTLRRADTNEALVSGVTPLSYTYGLTGVEIEAHVALSSDCDTENECRSITVTCTDCSPDIEAMISLYNNTDGANWVDNTGWVDGAAGTDCDPCSWYGVTCDANDRVICIDLDDTAGCNSVGIGTGNGLNGTLPTEISQLTELQELHLEGNTSLGGSLPAGLYDLVNLEVLSGTITGLVGPLSPSIANLQNLKELSLGNGPFDGPIPAELGDIASLTNLNLFYAEFSGPIPSTLGGLTNLVELRLNDNMLEGCFRSELSSLCYIPTKEFGNNAGLPGGGDFIAFCNSGTGDCSDEVPDCAMINYPLDGATDLPTSFTGLWTPAVTGGPAEEYDVSLGTDPTDLDFYGTTLGTSVLFSGLTDGIEYFWSVTPTNSNGPSVGCEVYSFTTFGPICGTVTLTSQTEVNNFDCMQIDGDLIIMDDNDGIDDIVSIDPIYLNGMQNGAIVTGDVILEGCNALTTDLGLDGIATIGGDFIIKDNAVLVDNSSNSLTSIGGTFTVENNALLDDIVSWFNVTSVGGLKFYNNPALTTIQFSALDEVTGSFEIHLNDLITQMDFPQLTSIGTSCFLVSSALSVLDGFPLLESTGSWLIIGSHSSLTQIDLPSLSSVSVELKINDNPLLTSVTGLDLGSLNGEFRIIDNPSLSDCCWAQPIIDLATGVIEIYDNATGCDTEAEIMGTPPELQFAYNLTGYKVRAEWLPVINADKYRVQYRKLGDTDWILKSTTSLFNLLVNLEPNTFYDIRLASRVCGVWGDYGVIVGFETSGCVSPDKDYDQSNYGSNHKVVLLPVEGANKYQVKYQFVGGTGNGIIKNYPNGDLDRNLIGLQPGTEYTIETRTRCSSGEWTPFESKEGFETSSCVAPSPTQITYPELGEAMIEWDAQENGTNYQIRYRIAGNPNWTVKASINPMKLLVDLEVGTNYLFQMRAKCPSWTAWSGNYSFSTPAPLDGESEITGRSISQPALDLSFGLYPNPTDGNQITIDFESGFVRVEGVEVYDLYGNMVMSQAMDSEIALKEIALTLDGNMIAGHYMMRVYFENESQVERFVIVK